MQHIYKLTDTKIKTARPVAVESFYIVLELQVQYPLKQTCIERIMGLLCDKIHKVSNSAAP